MNNYINFLIGMILIIISFSFLVIFDLVINFLAFVMMGIVFFAIIGGILFLWAVIDDLTGKMNLQDEYDD